MRYLPKLSDKNIGIPLHCRSALELLSASRDTNYMSVNVLVVEDDDLTRVTISAALNSAGFTVSGVAKTSAEALKLGKTFLAQAALIDLHLGKGPSGIDVAHELRKLDPRMGIVFLTTYEDPRLLSGTRELPQGSQYLVKKDVSDLEQIARSISLSLEGESRRVSIHTTGSLSRLSNTQLTTLRLLAEGLSNSEIARQRHVSEKSVEAVINRIALSLNVPRSEKSNTRVQLTRIYLEALGHSIAQS